MAENFDSLTIQITADAKKAIDAVNNLAKALERLNTALGGINTSGLENVSKSTGNLADSISKINTRKMKNVAESISNLANAGGNVAQTANATQNLAGALNSASESAKNVNKTVGANNGIPKFSQELNNTGKGANNFFSAVEKIQGALAKLIPHSNKASNSIKKFGSSSKKSAISAKSIVNELTRITKMMKLMITRMVLRKIITGVADGFKNLAQYSKTFDASVSLLWNSFRQLGNSIAAAVSPLINAFAPALNYIIQLVIQAVNAINQLLSALAGFGTWTKAKTLTDDYAKSLDKAGGAAKELKKTVLGFDELNQLQDNKSGGGGGATAPADMFETEQVADKWKKLADTIKKYWEKLVNPIKRAWAKAGDYVKQAWKRAFESVKNLAKDVVEDFLEVWNQPQTVHMLEDMFRIVGNIGTFVGNIANAFDRAWNKADVGKRILEHIRDICAIIVAHIEDITLSWALWADKVNFTPLLEGIDAFLASIGKEKGAIDSLMGVLSDLNDHFIQPVAKWLIEEGVPQLTKVFTDFSEKVDWNLLRERLDKVWSALANFTTESGQGFVQFVGDIADKLADGINSDAFGSLVDTLVDFMNNVKAEDIEDALKVIFGALVAYKTLTWLVACTSALKAFFALFETGGAAATAAGTMQTCAGGISALGTAFASIGLTGHFLEGLSNLKSVWEQRHEMDKYITTVEEVQKAQNDFTNQFGKDMQMIKDSSYGATESTRQSASDAQKTIGDLARKTETETYNIKEYYSDMGVEIPVTLNTLEKDQNSIFDSMRSAFDKSNWTFSGVADGLRETFKSAIDAIKGIWNGFVDSLNGSHEIFGHSININLPHIYASGGFPEDGLFMANHNELVGKFSNGRTAVANNEQITEGIARAVYAAMVSAGGSGGNARYINNTIQIDGRTIARAVTQGQSDLNRRYSPTMA